MNTGTNKDTKALGLILALTALILIICILDAHMPIAAVKIPCGDFTIKISLYSESNGFFMHFVENFKIFLTSTKGLL